MQRSFKYRIYPNKNQECLLNKHFGSVRFVYNYFLKQRINSWKNNKQSLSAYDQTKNLTKLKQREEYKWLHEISNQSLQQSIFNLDNAYKRFFKSDFGFPKFKSKKNKKDSFINNRSIFIKENKLKIPRFDLIKIVVDRPLEGKIKSCTISRTPTNKYYASINCEVDIEEKEKTNKSIGLDLGIKHLIITSNGKKYKNKKYTSKYEIKLAKAQKHLSRKVKGSNRYNKQKLKVALIHEKIANCRKDYLHKLSTKIINLYDIICVEDLSVANMVKNHKLAKSIQDGSWSKFISMLEYKSEWYGKKVVKIDKFFPSSKLCSNCGFKYEELSLKERFWVCQNCEIEHNRDINAAKNILNQGLNLISSGADDNIRGDSVRPIRRQESMKRRVS